MATSPMTYPTPPSVYTPGKYNTGSGGNNSVSGGWNPFAQRDVYNLYQQLGQNQFQQGQDNQDTQANLANYYLGNEAQAGQNVDNLYSPIWNGGGGLTPDMINNVTQSQGLDYLNNQSAYNFLTPEEQANIARDPYQASSDFQGANANLQQSVGQNGIAQDQLVTGGQQVGNDVLAQQKAGYDSAIDPSKLSLSSSYMPGLQSTLQTGRSDVGAAQGDPALDPTGQYLQQAGMSDQQVRDTAEAAARGVGAQFGATKDQVMQAAEASGTATPLGIAAAMGDLDRSSAASQSDALTQATLNAQAAQRQAAQNIQNTQLNASQYKAGLQSSNALALQNSDVAANTTAEQMRLAAQQGLTQQQTAAVQNETNSGLNQNQFITSQGLQSLQNQGQQSTQAQEYGATTNAGLTSAADTAASQRAQTIAGSRVAADENNQNFGLNTNTALSNRYNTAYQPWVTQQNKGLDAAVTEQQYAGSQGDAAQQRQLQWNGQQQSGTNADANGYASWGADQQKDAGVTGFVNNISKLASAAQSGAKAGGFKEGGLIDRHQLIEVGEHDRPEVILPLDPATPPDRRNPFERMGAQLGKEMGVRHYARGGVAGVGYDTMTEQAQPSGSIPSYESKMRMGPSVDSDAVGMTNPPAYPSAPAYSAPTYRPRYTPHMSGAPTNTQVPQESPYHPQYPQQPFAVQAPPDGGSASGGAGTMYGSFADTPMGHAARGGIVMPHIHMPRLATQGLHLNMPIRPPRISEPIHAAALPRGGTMKFSHGGMLNYRRNMGMHNRPLPLPYSEMGQLGPQ